jgi:uncharacterized damage-inducible protein DinB
LLKGNPKYTGKWFGAEDGLCTVNALLENLGGFKGDRDKVEADSRNSSASSNLRSLKTFAGIWRSTTENALCNNFSPTQPACEVPMEIQTIQQLLHYFNNVRERTMRVARCIPPDKLDWSYAPGKFTLGDLLRHLAVIERDMYAENMQGKPSRYTSHGKELADGYENVLAFMERLHQESMDIFSKLTDADLQTKCKTPAGADITKWKWLRLMTEHEIHHRGQIYLYLSMLGVPTPPLYGLTSEEVRARSTCE